MTEQEITGILNTLEKARDNSRFTTGINKRYWWNSKRSNQKMRFNNARRVITRTIRKGYQTEDIIKEYESNRKKLRDLMTTFKRNLEKKVCSELENDIWDQAYKLAVKLLGLPPVPYDIGLMKKWK